MPPVRSVKALSATSPPSWPPPDSVPSVSSASKASRTPALLDSATDAPSASAAAPCKARVPPATVTGPLKVLVPPSVRLPAPCLTSPPLPDNTPPNTVLVWLPPARRVKLLSVTLPPMAPPPASEPTVSSPNSTRPTPAALARLSATPSVSAAPPCRVRVPPCTATGPLKVLAPANVKLPRPCLTTPPLPDTTPANRVLRSLPPVLRLWVPSTRLPPDGPPPASAPMVWSSCSTSCRPATSASVKVPPLGSAAPPSSSSEPPAKVVSPV